MKFFLLYLYIVLAFQQVVPMYKDSVCDHVRGSVLLHFRKDRLQNNDCKRSPRNKDELISLKDIRARIVLNQNYKGEILKQIAFGSIEDSIKNILEKEKQRLLVLMRLSKKSCFYSPNELVKLSLLSSVSLPWDQTMEILRKLSPGNGVIYDYSFETAVFVMFLAPEYPEIFYKLWNSATYSKEVNFYKVCLASALKKCMEKQ